MNKGLNLFFSLLFPLFFVIACGDPAIDAQHVNFSKPNIEPMIPSDYLVGIGDELEIMYYINPGSALSEYLIDTEDTLLIQFDYYPKLNKTTKVRPDGFITLQRVGDIKAAGEMPRVLAANITKSFEPFLTRPSATVEVTDFNVKVKNLKDAVTTTVRGESKQVVVRPDGKISLPYINDVRVKDLTCKEVSQVLEEEYRKFVRNLSLTTAMLTAHSNRAYIMGEVRWPKFYELPGPITLSQLVATAGGFSENANTHQIVLIRRAKDGHPDARLIDMNNIIGRGDMSSDPIIKQYDVIFVPRTKLAQAALTMNSMSFIWNLIPARFSYSLGGRELE
ncbi:MAG: hypothetical protein D3924_04880 [Candidatus Electrothrix sp. AR4]|nr:hypothetical protein [Candidatus Electrothrix sp. AR4]